MTWACRLSLALTACVLPVADVAIDGAHATARPPNVVFIIADDLKASVVGFEGDEVVRTPNLDRLAAAGTSFARAYVPLPQCGPSRAALLVGRYPHATGALTNPGTWDRAHPTIAEILGQRGYRTGLVGKWHLQEDEKPQAGFDDRWCTIDRRSKSYFDPVLWIDGERRRLEGFLPDVLTDQAIDFIGDGRGDAPFFLWLAYKTPHEPWTQPKGDEFVYKQRWMKLPPTIKDDLSDKPAAQRDGLCHRTFLGRSRVELKKALQVYYAMITALDANVGRLMEHLAKTGIEQETLVVFLSDNGYMTGDHQLFTKGPFLYEEIIRTPLVLSWPGHVPAGGRRHELVSTLDVLPTVVGLAGAEVPEGVDGLDLMPLLRGEVDRLRDELFITYSRKLDEVVPILSVVTPDAKYVRYLETQEEELYDFTTDPLEMRNLAASPEHADRLAHLRARMETFQAGIEVPFW